MNKLTGLLLLAVLATATGCESTLSRYMINPTSRQLPSYEECQGEKKSAYQCLFTNHNHRMAGEWAKFPEWVKLLAFFTVPNNAGYNIFEGRNAFQDRPLTAEESIALSLSLIEERTRPIYTYTPRRAPEPPPPMPFPGFWHKAYPNQY